jgi:small-conductance mechanosensitive channel
MKKFFLIPVLRISLPVVILFLFIITGNLQAQQTGEIDLEMLQAQKLVAPVKVDGDVLFLIRGTTTFPASGRAEAISKRIRAAASKSLPVDSLKVRSVTDHMEIYAGSDFIMSVYPGDAEIEHLGLETFASLIIKKIRTTIEVYRVARSQPILIRKAIRAFVAAILMSAILMLFLWLFRKLNKLLQIRIHKRIESVENRSFKLIRSGQLWKAFHILFKTLRIGIIVLLIAFFLNYVLGLFPWTNNIATYTLKLFLDPIISMGNGILLFLPSLAFLIIIFLVTRYLLKLVKLLFAGLKNGDIVIRNFDPDWAMPTFKIMRVLIIAFSVIIAYPYIPGSDSSAFKGVSVFMGLLLSLGSSSFISNVIAGYSLTYRRAFKTGDRIKVNDSDGFVEEQSLLVTRLRSIKDEEIVIPNSMLINSSIINFTSRAKERGLILHTVVGIGYETPWRQVDAMLKLAAERTDGLLKDPPPYVLKLSLGDFAVNYEINVFCRDAGRMHFYYNALHQNILDVFNENNVQIMTPAYVMDPPEPKVVPADQWDSPVITKTEGLNAKSEGVSEHEAL